MSIVTFLTITLYTRKRNSNGFSPPFSNGVIIASVFILLLFDFLFFVFLQNILIRQ